MPRAAFSQIVNRSMSEVLTRSLATSFCTLLPVLALLLFGGETLKDFAFALMVGIASGAYSSIFIASPVLTHWKEREGGLPQPARADRARTRRGARLRDDRARARPRTSSPTQKRRRTRRGSLDRARGAGRADLARRVPGTRARPRRRRRAQRRSRRRRAPRARRREQRSGRSSRAAGARARARADARPGGRPDARGPRAQGRAEAPRSAERPRNRRHGRSR